MQRKRMTLLALPLVFAVVAASCGSDSGGDSSPDVSSGGGTNTQAPTDNSAAPAPATVPNIDTSVVENAADITPGGDVSFGIEAEAVGLRPWEDGCSEPCVNIMISLYDPLMQQRADGTYAGFLAEDISSNADFTVWTMNLRPGVTFHNGTPLTAQTIADEFPIQQTGTAASTAVATSNLVGVEATGDLEVTYTLSKPTVAFPSYLAGVALGFPFDPAQALADPNGYTMNPIGTGPFVISKRDIDNETVVTKNPNYWMKDANGVQLPYLDSVTFRPIPDEGTRLDALLSGTVTAFQTLRQGTIRDARAESGIELYQFQGSNTGGGFYNTAKAPYDDVRVRNGLTSLNNQDAVIEALGGTGISAASTQFFSVDSPWWTQAAADAYPPFDFDKGKADIQEYIDDPARSDGKAPGEKIDVEISCPPDPSLIAAIQVIQQVWEGTGQMNITLTQFDQATHINNGINDLTAVHCWRWSGEGDPSAYIVPFVSPPTQELADQYGTGAPSVSNFPNWFDPEVFEWAVAANQTDDFETRKDLYSKIMVRINEQNPIYYSGGTAVAIGAEPSVKGFTNWTLPDGELGNGIPGAIARWGQVYIEQ